MNAGFLSEDEVVEGVTDWLDIALCTDLSEQGHIAYKYYVKHSPSMELDQLQAHGLCHQVRPCLRRSSGENADKHECSEPAKPVLSKIVLANCLGAIC